MTLPLVNATLTEISGGGTSKDYDAPAGADAARWTGNTSAYVVDELVRATGPGSVDELRQTSIVIPAVLGRLVQRGDSLSYRYQDAEHTRAAKDVRVTELAGTARVALEDA